MKNIVISFLILFCLAGTKCYAQSMQYNQVLVFSSNDSLQTVPANKVWKLVNINGGPGQMTVSGAASAHCGTQCTGGSCSSTSCKYVGYIWELNGTSIDQVQGCYNCGGSACYNNIGACPANFTFAVTSLPSTRTPFWLTSGNTLKINATNVYFSIIEFNIVP